MNLTIRNTRRRLTLLVATAHIGMAGLSLFHRLAFSVPPRYELLAAVTDNQMWTWLHGSAALAVLVAVTLHKHIVVAMAASTGVMGAWSLLSFLWGLQTARPVSLAGPLLGTVIVALAYFLTMSYAVSTFPGVRTDGHYDSR